MTEGAALALRSGGSVTGFNQAMETGVPEPSDLGDADPGLRRARAGRGRQARQERAVRDFFFFFFLVFLSLCLGAIKSATV